MRKMKNKKFFNSIGLMLMALLTLIGCQRPQGPGGNSSVAIAIPSAAQYMHGKIGALAIGDVDYTRLCFVALVKGPDIQTTKNTCDVERGISSSAAGPGSSLSLDVPGGDGRVFEIYGLLRALPTDACPDATSAGFGTTISKVYFLGRSLPVTIDPPTATVSVDILLPQESNNLVVSSGMPTSCLPASAVSTVAGRVQSGAGSTSSTNYKLLRSRVGERHQDQVLLGTNHKLTGWISSH